MIRSTQRRTVTNRLILSAIAAASTIFLSAGAAHASELRIFSGGAVQPAVRSLLDELTARTGRQAVVFYGPVGATKARALGSEPADAVIVPFAALRELSDAGTIASSSRVDLWRVGIGVAVSKGARKPDLSTSAAFRQMLLDAPEIHYSDPALTSSAAYLVKLFERLGVADAVWAKARVHPRSEDALTALSQGATDAIAFAPVPEILAESHVDLAAPLPAEVQNRILYSGAVLMRSKQPEAAIELLRFLALPEHVQKVQALGLEGPQ